MTKPLTGEGHENDVDTMTVLREEKGPITAQLAEATRMDDRVRDDIKRNVGLLRAEHGAKLRALAEQTDSDLDAGSVGDTITHVRNSHLNHLLNRHQTNTSTGKISVPAIPNLMAPTVDDYRNEIRLAVNRFERPDSTAFTKETLAALCEAVNYDIDTNRLPPKAEMRAGILWQIGLTEEIDIEEADRPFRKAELKAIANELTSSHA